MATICAHRRAVVVMLRQTVMNIGQLMKNISVFGVRYIQLLSQIVANIAHK